MPRLVPRLLRIISREESLEKTYPFDIRIFRCRPKSLVNPNPPKPSFHPAKYPRSILLTSAPLNPITRSRFYFRHKSLPPRIYLPKRPIARANEHDRPRQMSEDERRWWANPYLRMLSSPIRRCMVTNRYFPSDFLIRLGPVRLPAKTSTNIVLVPDGLQHTKFTARRLGRAVYVLCSRGAFRYIQKRGQSLVRGQRMHPNLGDYVAHLLRLRVLQELELLVEQLECSSNVTHEVIRRLTRQEWENIKDTGTIPFANAVAVLVVPPLNKDPKTKQRPEPIMSAAPLPDDGGSLKQRSSLPLFQLLPEKSSTEHPDILPSYQVPLYHSIALFPNKHQRAALHSLLLRILAIQRRSSQPITRDTRDKTEVRPRASGDAKYSHAFLISSDSDSVLRGDISSTAIALWRVQMFESDEMDDNCL